jgi:hypothetical protein
MKKFVVPVTWQVSSYVVIEAETADEAAEQAEEGKLPRDSEYVMGSFEADFECVEEVKHCLAYGDEVFWNDPDDGICSGKAFFRRFMRIDCGNDVAIIEKDGVEMECYVDEIS